MAIYKNLQFFSNQADILVILRTNELVILSKFHKDWQEIVDFLAIRNFEPVQFFLHQSLDDIRVKTWYHFELHTLVFFS